MRKILRDFYLGNFTPGEQEMVPGTELKRAITKVARCEQQLTERLGEADRVLLNELSAPSILRTVLQRKKILSWASDWGFG